MLTHLFAESQDWATGNSKLCCRVEALEFKEPGAQKPAIKPLCGDFANFFGVPIVRMIAFGVLYWGPPIWGNSHRGYSLNSLKRVISRII